MLFSVLQVLSCKFCEIFRNNFKSPSNSWDFSSNENALLNENAFYFQRVHITEAVTGGVLQKSCS